MSTELSAAEKRRLLRERRQQKFSNGGASSRLNKITGQQEGSFLSSKSVLDEKKPAPAPAATTTATSFNANSSTSNADKSTEEIEEMLSRIPNQKAETEPDNSESNPEIALFQQLLKMQQQGSGIPAAGNGFGSQSPDASTSDLFTSLLNSDRNTTAAATAAGQGSGGFVDESVLKYHQYKVSKLKSYITLLKWIILTPYIYFIMHPNPAATTIGQYSSIASQLLEKSNFFSIFTGLEVIFISIYYQMLKNLQRKNNVTPTQNAGGIVKYLSMIPEGILPIKNVQGKIGLALEYFDVFSMYVTDICFVVVLFGLMKHFHASFPTADTTIEEPIVNVIN